MHYWPLGIAVAVFSLVSSPLPLVGIEEPAFEVVQEEGSFQVRRYSGYLTAAVEVETAFGDAGNAAFRTLFDYISGANISAKEISMTAPVTQESVGVSIPMTAPVTQEEVGGRYRVAFVMPAEYTLESIPEPKDKNISIIEVPSKTMAVVRYSGFWSESNYQYHLDELRKWMAENDLEEVAPPVWARYNSPFSLWFWRRNEILVEVKP